MEKRNIAVAVGAVAIILLLLLWAPWLDDGQIKEKLYEKQALRDGTIDRNGNVICEYKIMWAPFGRWAASCEGGYFVTFFGFVIP